MFIHHYPIPHHRDGLSRYMAAFATLGTEFSRQIRKWCFDTFGEPGYRIHIDETRWIDDVLYGEVIFEREEDLMLFVLKWST